MLRVARIRVLRRRSCRLSLYRQYSSSKVSDPLRILFCGSDEFSCASLEALHDEHAQNAALVQSIDVVVRPGKRTGRGLKEIRQGMDCPLSSKRVKWADLLSCIVPISRLAASLGLRIHERDTFTGWNVCVGAIRRVPNVSKLTSLASS